MFIMYFIHETNVGVYSKRTELFTRSLIMVGLTVNVLYWRLWITSLCVWNEMGI